MPIFLDDATLTRFRKHYWRQCHYFVEAGCATLLPSLQIASCADNLHRLARRELVESRIVDNNAHLHLGPFADDETLPPGLLMVQGIEQYFDGIDELLKTDFGFMPRWRIDDVMASLAMGEASCGAHFDRYDVFLIQIHGTKMWQLDSGEHDERDLDPHASVRLLRDFSAKTRLTAGPGDVLYIPAGMGHFGIGEADSITLSVGVRNPTLVELVSHLADHVVDDENENSTLDEELQIGTAGIGVSDIDNLRRKLSAVLLDETLLAQWYGSYVTELREPEILASPHTPNGGTNRQLAIAESNYECALATRISFFQQAQGLIVFVNGQIYHTTEAALPWIKILCAERQVNGNQIPSEGESAQLLHALLDSGAILPRENIAYD